MVNKKSDPTKDPEFQKVVKRMLATPPKPRKQKKDIKSRRRPTARQSGQD